MAVNDQADDKSEVDETEENEGDADEGEDKKDQKVEIDGQELTPEEAAELVKTGKSFKELQDKYPDIDFNELPGGFTKANQELKELKEKAKTEELSPDEEKRREQIDDFFGDPYVKEKIKAEQAQDQQQLKEDLAFEEEAKSLEAELDGSDGRPKFVRKEVLDYGKEHNLFNLRSSYNDMHEKELDEWKLKKALEKKRPSTFVERGGSQGSKLPDAKAPKDFKEATAAALKDEEDY